jgi:hypothetical protein
MPTLKEWLAAKDMPITRFASLIERTPEAVRRYVNGERIPDRETMPAIVRHTGGDVTPNDFFGIGTPALCTVCDHRLDDVAIRACSLRDCPNAQRDAA